MLKFSEILKEYAVGDNPTVRSPAGRDFLNQHLVLKYKLSIPTEDENVFNAANIQPYGGRLADKKTHDDISAGYHRPVMFGDYLDYLMKMRNESVDETLHPFILFIEENLSDEEMDSLLETELPELDEEELAGLKDFVAAIGAEVKQIDEISLEKIKDYRQKAYTSRKVARAKGDLNTAHKRHLGLQRSSDAYFKKKRETNEEVKLEEGNVWASTDGKYFGKNRKGFTRKFESKEAAASFAKEEYDIRDFLGFISEGKRGRPPKNKPAGEDEEHEHQPILVQLRKHEISRGQTKIRFNDGTEHHVEPHHVKKALDKHVHLRTSIEKGDYQEKLAHSHASFKKAIGVHD